MKAVPISMAIVLASSVAALACPSLQQPGETYVFTGGMLVGGQSAPVTAGGSFDVAACGLPGIGAVAATPDFSLILSAMDAYDLELSVVSECDSTLLVNTVNTTWLFDDDSNGNLDPSLSLTNPNELNGRVDVWVGRYGSNSCNGSPSAR